MPNASQTLAGGHCVWRNITRASKECRIYLHLRCIRIMGLRYGGLTLPLVSTGMATHMGEVHYSQMVPVVISAAVWTKGGKKVRTFDTFEGFSTFESIL